MNEMNELKLQAAIDDRMGDLVKLGNDIIIKVMPKADGIDLATQLRNAIAIANSSPHPAVLTNFIRYQIGRQTTAKAWKSTGLGEDLISAIEGDVQRWAAEISDKGNAADVQMRLSRLLLGFMTQRYFYEAYKVKDKRK